jgi:hypothetical protein
MVPFSDELAKLEKRNKMLQKKVEEQKEVIKQLNQQPR